MPRIHLAILIHSDHIFSPHDRPGRHYAYVQRYVLYHINLLRKTKDASGLRQMMRKLRGSGDDVLLSPVHVWTTYRDALLEVRIRMCVPLCTSHGNLVAVGFTLDLYPCHL